MALVYYYFDPKGQSEDSHRATLIATTLVVVMFSITVFGAVTKPLLDFTLGMGQGGRGSPPPRCKHPPQSPRCKKTFKERACAYAASPEHAVAAPLCLFISAARSEQL